MKRLLYIIIIVGLISKASFGSVKTAYAIYNPLEVPNNKYGIHITDENDLTNAAALVNSSNGDWGYVTIAIREDDRNEDKWNNIFNKMKRLHLIPIIRLATIMQSSIWRKPDIKEVNNWAQFLNMLKWPIQNRYVVIFNEPNHSKEWGGVIDPGEYVEILRRYSDVLKAKSSDFYILQAGFDASAPEGTNTMDEVNYIKHMLEKDNNIFDHIDGWASHSYPNPGFIGKVDAVGRGTIRTFAWEQEMLRSLGIDNNFPVFITETGWPHNEGDIMANQYYSSTEISQFLKIASDTVWVDDRIVAITPFILNYRTYPFSNFSWQKSDFDNFYPHFDAYRSIPKIKGKPKIYLTLSYLQENILGVMSDDFYDNSQKKSFWEKLISSINRNMFNIISLIND